MRNDIAADRKINPELLNNLADSLKIKRADDGVKFKLLDGLKYRDEMITYLMKKVGVENEDDLKLQNFEKYAKKLFYQDQVLLKVEKPAIAVILAEGDVSTSGEGLTSEGICKLFKKVRNAKHIKTVVFRINSPGGSALASEEIWREVELTNKVKKVIVSMGDVAASGGYYIAAPADVIVAEPNTITGSIGVFGMLINAKELLNNKLGVKIETVKFGEFSDLGSPDRPLTAAERQVVQNAIDRVYADFVKRVAEGRKLTEAQVDSIAQGRVWSGIEAKQIGLVDEFGGLDRAIDIAVKKAKLSEHRVVSLPELKDPLEEVFKTMSGEASAYFMKQELGSNYQHYLEAKKALQYQGIQVRMPFTVDVE
jgi:protease-4